MPEHDPNGAARRPVLKRVDHATASEVEDAGANGRLWIFCGEYEAKGGEVGASVAADAAHREHGPGIFVALDAGSWGRGYWRAEP